MGRLLFLTLIMYGLIIFGQTAAEAAASVHDGTMESRAATDAQPCLPSGQLWWCWIYAAVR